MSKKIKAVKKVLLLIVVLIILVMIMVYSVGNQMLKAGIEKAATKSLNVGVAIEDVDLSILGGKVEVEKIVVDNPPGYEHEKMVEIDKVKVTVSIGSLLSDMVNVKEIALDGIDVVIEQKGLSNNLQEIINSIPKSEKKAKTETEKSAKKLHIDSLEITNVTVNVKLLPIPGKSDTIQLELDPILMTDLGGEDGIDTTKLAGKILLAISKAIAEKGSGVLPAEMTDELKDSLAEVSKLAEEGKKLLEKGKNVIKGIKGFLKSK
jgi:hypothetical protein